MPKTENKTEVKPKYQFLMIGKFAWGKGQTPDEARKKCRSNMSSADRKDKKSPFVLYRLLHEDTNVDGCGGIEYPQGFRPIIVETNIADIVKYIGVNRNEPVEA